MEEKVRERKMQRPLMSELEETGRQRLIERQRESKR